jgi:hypothetical protein
MRWLLAAAVAVAGLSTALAQQRLDPSATPAQEEPQHHLVFANAFVRVLDATFPAGYVTLNHSHLADNVIVTLAPGRDDAQALTRIGRAVFNAGGYSHTVTNPGPREARFIEVDLLGTDHPKAAAVSDTLSHVLELENDRVRIYRVKLVAGEKLSRHTHHAGWVSVTVVGGASQGRAEWHAAGSANPLSAGPAPLEIVEIEPRS